MESFQSPFLKVPLIWLIQFHSLEKNLETQSQGLCSTCGSTRSASQRFPSRSRTQSGSTLRTRARGPLFRARRSRARREDWRADWLLEARPAAGSSPASILARQLAERPCAHRPRFRAPRPARSSAPQLHGAPAAAEGA